MFFKVGLKVPVADRSRGHVLHEKLELLHEPSTKHRIVRVEASAQRFPIEDLLPEPSGQQGVQRLRIRGRPHLRFP